MGANSGGHNMTQWLVLLRGVNVGGHNRLPMAALRDLTDALWPDAGASTYIASGNLIFTANGQAADISQSLSDAIAKNFNLTVPILTLPSQTFLNAVATCPYTCDTGKTVHGYFYFKQPTIDTGRLADLRVHGEGLTLCQDVLWLHTPPGFGKSKLAERLGSVTGNVSMTARNLNSCRKLAALLDG